MMITTPRTSAQLWTPLPEPEELLYKRGTPFSDMTRPFLFPNPAFPSPDAPEDSPEALAKDALEAITSPSSQVARLENYKSFIYPKGHYTDSELRNAFAEAVFSKLPESRKLTIDAQILESLGLPPKVSTALEGMTAGYKMTYVSDLKTGALRTETMQSSKLHACYQTYLVGGGQPGAKAFFGYLTALSTEDDPQQVERWIALSTEFYDATEGLMRVKQNSFQTGLSALSHLFGGQDSYGSPDPTAAFLAKLRANDLPTMQAG